MPIELTSNIVPKNNGTFPTHDSQFGRGGRREVDTLTERDAIPGSRRSAGMEVWVRNEGKSFLLQTNLTSWIENPLSSRLSALESSLAAIPSSINKSIPKLTTSVDTQVAVFNGVTGKSLKQSSFDLSVVAGKQDRATRILATGPRIAALGNLIACDTTGGTFSITLPLSSAGKGEIKIKWILGSSPPTIVLQAPDVLDKIGGITTFTPNKLGQVYTLESDGGIWTQTTDDYIGYLKTGGGASQIGHARSVLTGPALTIDDFINSDVVSVWEYINLITVKPNPSDWSTWDWQPAITGALNASKRVLIPQMDETLAYRTSAFTMPRGDAELIVPAAQNIVIIGLATDAYGVTLTGDFAKIFGGIWRTENPLANIIRTNGFRQMLFDVKAGIGSEGGCKNALTVDGLESIIVFGRYRSGTNTGILVKDYDLYLQNVYCEQNRVGLRSDGIGAITAHHVHAFSNSFAGFYLAGAAYSQLMHCKAENSGRNGFEIRDVNSGLTLVDCWGYKSSNALAGNYDFAFYGAKEVRMLGGTSSGAGAFSKGGSIRLQADSKVAFVGTRAETALSSNSLTVALQRSTFTACTGTLRKYNKPGTRVISASGVATAAGGTVTLTVEVPVNITEYTGPSNLLFQIKLFARTTTGSGDSISSTVDVIIGLNGVANSLVSVHSSDLTITAPTLTDNSDGSAQLGFMVTNNNALPVEIVSFAEFFGFTFADLSGVTALTAPKVSGNVTPGSTLTATPGTYSSNPTYSGQWYRSGSPVGGQTGLTYIVPSGGAVYGTDYYQYRDTPGGTLIVGSNVLTPALPAPLLLEAFDSLTGFTFSNSPVTSIDTVNKVQGTGSLAVASTSGSSPGLSKANIYNGATTDLETIAFYFDTQDIVDPDYISFTGIDCRLGRGGTHYQVTNVTSPTQRIRGGFWHAFAISDIIAASAGFAALGPGQIDLFMNMTAHNMPYVSKSRIDALYAQAKGRPTFILTFDDAAGGQYDKAFKYMQTKGLKASCYLPTSLVGQSGRLTIAQIREMDDAGWDMALNGTANDTSMTVAPRTSAADCVTGLQAMQTWLTTNGVNNRAKDHICYPNGSFELSGTVLTATGTLNSTATIGVSDLTGIAVNMKAIGLGLPVGARVQSIDVGLSQVTLTLAATVTGSRNVKFVDDSPPFHQGKLQAALAAAGFKTARTTLGSSIVSPFYSRFGIAGRGLLLPGYGSSSASAANLNARVDKAILMGGTTVTYAHDVTDVGGSINLATADFNAFIDYLASKRDAGLIDVLTLSEWWARDCANPATPP